MKISTIITCAMAALTFATPATADEPPTVLATTSPLVAIRVIVPAGAQFDPPGKEGLAALTASLVAEGGTQALAYPEILARFYPIAGSVDGVCRKEVAVFSGVIHRDNLQAYTPLFRAMLATPRFAQDDFDRLRNRALDTLTNTLRGNNDEELGKAVLQLAIYGGHHPYGHVNLGTVEGLKALTIDDVRAFHAAHYGRGGMRIGVAGGADAALAKRLSDDLTDPARGTVPPPELPKVETPPGIALTLVQKPSDATAISIGFAIDVNRHDDDFYALFLANSYLGEHRTFNGKLMQHLRRDRGLNYGDYSYVEEFLQDGGTNLPVPNNPRRQQFFSIWVRPVPHDKAAFALRAALFELDRLTRDGLSPDNFETTRTFLLNYSNLYTQTLERRLGYAMEGQLYCRGGLVEELHERLPKLTVEDVNAAIRKHLKSRGLAVAIVTKDAEGLRKQLESGDPTPIVYDTQGTPESILAEDEQIARFPLPNLTTRILPASVLFETPGLPQAAAKSAGAIRTRSGTAFYVDSPAQLSPADGVLAAGTDVAVLAAKGVYRRVRFPAPDGSGETEAWIDGAALEAGS